MQLKRSTGRTPTPEDRRGAKPARLVRGGVLLSLAGLLGVGMALGDHFEATPNEMNDGSAWLADDGDLVRGSALTGEADAMVAGVVKGTAQIAQDGNDAIVVVGGKAFAMDSSTLKPSGSLAVAKKTTALTRGGKGYLISAGLITCVDPQTLSQVGGTIATPASASAPAPGVVDEKGQLWVAMKRTGEVWRIRDCVVDKRAAVFGKGHDVALTLAGGRPVLHDEDADTVTWIDTRSAKAKASGDVPHDALLQGPSMEGDRVWLAGPGRILTGVALDGSVVTIDLSQGGLHRPEVLGERVVVPSKEQGGAVVVVDAPPGERPTELVTKPLPAATEDDFDSFIKDGTAWYSAPGASLHGTVASNGEIDELVVAKADLEAAAEAAPQEPADVAPVAPTPPPADRTPDTPAPTIPSSPATPVTPSGPTPSTTPMGTGGTTTTTVAPTTTTTTAPEEQIQVRDVRTLAPQTACEQLRADGLRCTAEAHTSAPASGTEPLDVITDQDPPAGRSVTADQTVTVRYYGSVVVPNLDGLHRMEACPVVESAGLVCGTGSTGPSPRAVKPDGIYEQSLAAGSRVAAHSTITVKADATVWEVLTVCHVPGEYTTTVLRGQACAPNLNAKQIGLAATTQAAGTVPLYASAPNGAAAANCRDTVLSRSAAAPDSKHGPGTLLGYVYATQVTGTQYVNSGVSVGTTPEECPNAQYYTMSTNGLAPRGYMWAPGPITFYTWEPLGGLSPDVEHPRP